MKHNTNKQINTKWPPDPDRYNLFFLHHFKWSEAITLPKYFPRLETNLGRLGKTTNTNVKNTERRGRNRRVTFQEDVKGRTWTVRGVLFIRAERFLDHIVN